MNEKEPIPQRAPERKKPRRRFDAAFKNAAVEHCQRQGGSVADTANELGINYWTLRDWMESAKAGSSPPSPATVPDLEAENRRLKLELAKVTEQREILKKSLGILSTQ